MFSSHGLHGCTRIFILQVPSEKCHTEITEITEIFATRIFFALVLQIRSHRNHRKFIIHGTHGEHRKIFVIDYSQDFR